MTRLAFLISAHTDAPQLLRLIEALPADSEFFVHIDSKSDITQFTGIISNERVHFITHRVNVVWGSINEVEYQMELVRAALQSGVEFTYLITISGMDYPLWSPQRIIDFFSQSDGKEYLCGNDLSWQGIPARIYRQYRLFTSKPWPKESFKSKMRVAMRYFIRFLGIRKPLIFFIGDKKYHLYKGAAWWAITPGLAEYVLNEWDGNEQLKEYFTTSFCPAETFVQTVVFNSEWKDKCIEWSGEYRTLADLTPLTYIYYVPVIKILTEEDYDIVMKSGKMFGRKFVSGKSDGLIKMLASSDSE